MFCGGRWGSLGCRAFIFRNAPCLLSSLWYSGWQFAMKTQDLKCHRTRLNRLQSSFLAQPVKLFRSELPSVDQAMNNKVILICDVWCMLQCFAFCCLVEFYVFFIFVKECTFMFRIISKIKMARFPFQWYLCWDNELMMFFADQNKTYEDITLNFRGYFSSVDK